MESQIVMEDDYMEVIKNMTDEELFEYNKDIAQETARQYEAGELKTMTLKEFERDMDKFFKKNGIDIPK